MNPSDKSLILLIPIFSTSAAVTKQGFSTHQRYSELYIGGYPGNALVTV